ncbi:hypothetical protein BHK98_08735 [Hornefia porci]|uniref:CobW/HypB/UreG nucleotide-binding domain-containing protein n=1 Tax=Hornefia porci TaxID=2652292 RepID=A0A1Q9JIU3_9FIRM|nr:GTP-binding protein [Hornefia porci]OLR56142.1 hypothetical protein BHK98_08735 [Hornefia porci]
MKSKIMLIGGFLGAGKTTMLSALASVLEHRNYRYGLITNDQAAGLVDTAFLTAMGNETREVSGSCFCCNFPGFESALAELRMGGCNVILAEPVGSCTDLSATILQPLKEQYTNMYEIAPLAVLADPMRLQALCSGEHMELHESSIYIMKKQMEEADILVINKCDLLSEEKRLELQKTASLKFPRAKVLLASAEKGEGLEQLADELLSDESAGKTLACVDYNIYAEGEAVLGWLNLVTQIKSDRETDWSDFLEVYMKDLKRMFVEKAAAVGHLKLLLSGKDENSWLLGNLVGNDRNISLRGKAPVCREVILTVNARVQMMPEQLADSVISLLEAAEVQNSVKITHEILRQECLSPGRPEPTYHYEEVL